MLFFIHYNLLLSHTFLLFVIFFGQFVTTNGVAEFAYTMGTYGYKSPISSSDVSSLPMCEYDGNGYYYGVGCSSSGTFTIDRFSDAYCTQYYDTYDKLSNLNSALKSLSKCYYIYSTKTDEDPSYSLANYLINESTSCSSAEHDLCTTSAFVANSASYASKQKTSSTQSRSNLSKLTDKLKYTLGTAMLCGSAIMFVGILFTNRKKRRAMMHGKLKSKSDSSKSKSRSKSRSSSQKQKSSSTKKKRSSSLSGAAAGGGIFA